MHYSSKWPEVGVKVLITELAIGHNTYCLPQAKRLALSSESSYYKVSLEAFESHDRGGAALGMMSPFDPIQFAVALVMLLFIVMVCAL